jgi:hypothetical protein
MKEFIVFELLSLQAKRDWLSLNSPIGADNT